MMLFNKKVTPAERLLRAVVQVCNHEEMTALVPVIMLGKREMVPADHSVPTAATDGLNEFYNEGYIDQLTDPELRFIVIHENFHKKYVHPVTWAHLWRRDEQLTNFSCDYVINGEIIKLCENITLQTTTKTEPFAVMPKGGLYDPRFDGMNTRQVYDILKREQEQQQQQSADGDGDGSPQDGSGSPQDGTPMDHHDWADAQSLTDEQKADMQQQVADAIAEGKLAAQKLGRSLRALGDLVVPKVDWKEAMRDFVSTACAGSEYSTWRRPSRRFIGYDIYMPSGVSETVDNLLIAIDTSGSICGDALTAFLSEVTAICKDVKPKSITLVYWDAEVARIERYDEQSYDSLTKTTKPAGGGGTDVNCVCDALRSGDIAKPQAAVVLTDGYLYGGWGSWTCPVLWCVLNNRRAVPTVGTVVHIDM